jgi:(2R)-3-sulfolactate dehydrogenase (NADP+)
MNIYSHHLTRNNTMSQINISLKDVQEITQAALEGAGANQSNAASVAKSTVLAERDGIRSHGLMYVPIYAEHLSCGKVDGKAIPEVNCTRPSAICVDAKSGFAHPAIDAGWDAFTSAARKNGVAAMTLYNSYNCGVLGHHAERLAKEGLIGLCLTHAPASIAPSGASTPVIGTNPISIAVPDGKGGTAIVIDQSASVVAKSEIMLRARTGKSIPAHWALDEHGQPTTDPNLALKGSMAPSGGYKGFGIGLLVEILASCLSGAVLSKDASPFSGTKGGPPSTGQCFIAFDPGAYSGDTFFEKIKMLVSAISDQEGAHLPGSKGKVNRLRIDDKGVMVNQELLDKINNYAKM